MFTWLWSWLRRTPEPYTAKERLIYRYFNGSKWVEGDPLRLWRRVMAHGAELRIAVKLANSLSKDADQGAIELAKKVREIFAIPEEDTVAASGTLTDDEVFTVFDEFMKYVDDLKKKSKKSLMSSNSSGASRSGSPPAPTTNSSSASGCAVNVPTCAVPVPPPSPTVSPLQPMT